MGNSHGKETILEELRRRIRLGQYAQGDRLPSERDLSHEFSVSRSVIQAVVDSLVNSGLVNRVPNHRPVVQSFADESGPNMDQSRNHIAIWIQPNLEDLGAARILQGVCTEISDGEYSLLIGVPPSLERDTEQRSEAEFLRQMVSRSDIAGAIVWETGGPDFASIYKALRENGIPVVFIDREPPCAVEADVVATNHRRGAMKAVQHLLALGHREIVFVANDEHVSSVRDRIDGFRLALEQAGVTFTSEMIAEMPLTHWETDPSGPDRFIDSLLARPTLPTAIFAVNDKSALFLIDALESRGVRVPEDISIVGFDWLQRSLPAGGSLTTIAQPFEAIGRVAAQTLKERIRGVEPSLTRHVLLEASLVVRKTTAPLRLTPALVPS